MALGVLSTPGACRLAEQLLQRGRSQPLPRLLHRTLADQRRRQRGQRQIQRRQYLGHRLMPIERQGNEQPHYLLGLQSPPPDTGRSRDGKDPFNPR